MIKVLKVYNIGLFAKKLMVTIGLAAKIEGQTKGQVEVSSTTGFSG
jgi:hypothetical protein